MIKLSSAKHKGLFGDISYTDVISDLNITSEEKEKGNPIIIAVAEKLSNFTYICITGISEDLFANVISDIKQLVSTRNKNYIITIPEHSTEKFTMLGWTEIPSIENGFIIGPDQYALINESIEFIPANAIAKITSLNGVKEIEYTSAEPYVFKNDMLDGITEFCRPISLLNQSLEYYIIMSESGLNNLERTLFDFGDFVTIDLSVPNSCINKDIMSDYKESNIVLYYNILPDIIVRDYNELTDIINGTVRESNSLLKQFEIKINSIINRVETISIENDIIINPSAKLSNAVRLVFIINRDNDAYKKYESYLV